MGWETGPEAEEATTSKPLEKWGPEPERRITRISGSRESLSKTRGREWKILWGFVVSSCEEQEYWECEFLTLGLWHYISWDD